MLIQNFILSYLSCCTLCQLNLPNNIFLQMYSEPGNFFVLEVRDCCASQTETKSKFQKYLLTKFLGWVNQNISSWEFEKIGLNFDPFKCLNFS